MRCVMMVELIVLINDFHGREFLDKGSNASYISLIPKKARAYSIGDYRSVSLVGSTYKIILICLF